MCTRIEVPESFLPEIEAALRKEKDAKTSRWLLGVRLMALKETPSVIGPQLGVTEQTVRNWTHRFLSGGIEALRRRKSPGHPTTLPREEEERFKERIRQGPAKEDGIATWRGLSVIAMLQREFGVVYKLSGVYDLLHRLGFSSLMPRALHPDSSEEERERFKKNTPGGGQKD